MNVFPCNECIFLKCILLYFLIYFNPFFFLGGGLVKAKPFATA